MLGQSCSIVKLGNQLSVVVGNWESYLRSEERGDGQEGEKSSQRTFLALAFPIKITHLFFLLTRTA
jgi:hypothetical protein